MADELGRRRPRDETLDAWASRVVPRAVAYARTLTRRPSDAEDVVHDVLCRLLDHKEYDLIADGEKLLFRSVTNACINRATRRREMASLDQAFDAETGWSVVVQSKAVADPVDRAIANELNDAIGRGLARLPAMQRAAVELKSLRYSLKEIAQMLNVSASNAGVLVHRARKALAEVLSPMLSANRSDEQEARTEAQGGWK